jgi:hypothetical protein
MGTDVKKPMTNPTMSAIITTVIQAVHDDLHMMDA